MKIIDAHLHYTSSEYFEKIARLAGGENSFDFLEQDFKKNNIVMGIGMGNVALSDETPGAPSLLNLDSPLELSPYNYPDFTCFCAGINTNGLTPESVTTVLDKYEKVLKSPRCVGLKAYAGYYEGYIYDDIYLPFFELAGHYGVPVVIHTGETANGKGRIKYSHPIAVDEAASQFPETDFVIAHYGNPWIIDAMQVAIKNKNVFIDLSGLIEGCIDPSYYLEKQAGYISYIKTWTTYMSRYEKFMFGSDWPLVNLDGYIEVIANLIPESKHDLVFFENACNIFKKLPPLLKQSSEG